MMPGNPAVGACGMAPTLKGLLILAGLIVFAVAVALLVRLLR